MIKIKESTASTGFKVIKNQTLWVRNYFVKKINSIFLALILLFISISAFAQNNESTVSSVKLKKLSLEELMNIEVTSVSNRPEKLTEVASAIQVITAEDIRRLGTVRLPKSLLLASNLQIMKANSHDWAITARGFNGLPSSGGILANKLLVMIDGRSIYNPLFGGVYWDVQNTLLEDVNRIEVVSGPGGTLWGANAINGVINVVTKSAKETQGLYLTGAKGDFINSFGAIRIGSRSKVDSNLYFRMYFQQFDQGSTKLVNGASSKDAWKLRQGGFRLDYYPSETNTFTLQGDAYEGVANQDSLLKYVITNGQNLLARFTHTYSETSDLKIQGYFDRTWRSTPSAASPFFYVLNTFDFDVQHRFALGEKQSILYGGNVRLMEDRTTKAFNPQNSTMPVYSGFIQDEIAVIPQFLKMTIGSKILHNVFTGVEFQPSIRLAFSTSKQYTIWSAVSRAVRTPSRFDADIEIKGSRLAPFGFKSEKVVAYELGYRVQPAENISLSFAAFFNHYDDVRSLNSNSNPNTPTILANSQKAESWGFEFFGNYKAREWWRLRGGYTFFDRNIWATSPYVLPVSVAFESVDPNNVFMLQSIMDLPRNFSLDILGRFLGSIPSVLTTKSTIPMTPNYFSLETRIAKQVHHFEFSLVGQNLLIKEHSEVGNSKIPRTFYARIICQF